MYLSVSINLFPIGRSNPGRPHATQVPLDAQRSSEGTPNRSSGSAVTGTQRLSIVTRADPKLDFSKNESRICLWPFG